MLDVHKRGGHQPGDRAGLGAVQAAGPQETRHPAQRSPEGCSHNPGATSSILAHNLSCCFSDACTSLTNHVTWVMLASSMWLSAQPRCTQRVQILPHDFPILFGCMHFIGKSCHVDDVSLPSGTCATDMHRCSPRQVRKAWVDSKSDSQGCVFSS